MTCVYEAGPLTRLQPYRTPGQPQPGWAQQPAGRAQSRPGQPAAAAGREHQWAGVAHRDDDDDDDLSSKWSLDDNVRRLLYDDRSVSGVGTVCDTMNIYLHLVEL
jgi:hypothetical protein